MDESDKARERAARRSVPTHVDAPRVNLRMRSDRLVNLYDPASLDIELDDWVVGASRVPRWGGQTKGELAYNDLCHMLLTERIMTEMVWPDAPAEARRWALAHDLHEGAGLGDICTPYGRLFAEAGLRELKGRLDRALRLAMGLSAETPMRERDAIKRADRIAAVSEAVQLMRWPGRAARREIGLGYRRALWDKPLELLGEEAARTPLLRRYPLPGGPPFAP